MITVTTSAAADQIELALPEGSAGHVPAVCVDRYRAFMRREPQGADSDWLQVDTYKAWITAIDSTMIDQLHALTMSVFWPHRAPDLALMNEMGTGWLASDEIGRPLSSAMGFPAGDDFAMLGMMVTTPRLQSHGSGSRLLRRMLKDQAGRDLRLSATRQGYRLYEAAGFTPVKLVHQHQGVARDIRPPEAVQGVSIRPFEQRDAEAMAALDRAGFGADRSRVLQVLQGCSEVVVAERGGALEGFAMCRRFGKGRVIGPLLAEQTGVAKMLAAYFIRQHAGEFLRLDTIVDDDSFEAFASAAGLGVYDTVTDMRLGRLRRASTGMQTYGLAMQSLG